MQTGIERIAAERQRQIDKERWSSEHDDEHTDFSLSAAAACYANPFSVTVTGEGIYCETVGEELTPIGWPDSWDGRWWKPSDDPIRNLEKAGALIAAEIDRLQRLQKQTQ